jgi:outer membrane immunogenic protein
MRKPILAGIAIVTLGLFSAAEAAQKPAPGYGAWSGLYVGAFASYANGDADLIFNTRNEDGHFWNMNHSVEGWAGGVQVGYDWRFGHMVLGVLGTYSFADMDGSRRNPQDGSNFIGVGGPVNGPPVQFTTTIDNIVTLETRGGFLYGEHTLLYTHGGVAFADISLSGTGGPANNFQTQSSWTTGWIVGVGVEHKFTSRISGFAQYSYLNFPDAELHLITDGSDYQGAVNNQGRDLNMFTMGLNVKLN